MLPGIVLLYIDINFQIQCMDTYQIIIKQYLSTHINWLNKEEELKSYKKIML